MDIRLASEFESGAFVEHFIRSALESGRDGDPLARARSADDLPARDVLHARLRSGWAREVGAVGWERAFGLWADGELVGHLDLRGGHLPSELHRATLGVGIERPWRRAGWGRRLMEKAIEWARDHKLAWLDLGVFSENHPARELYSSLGFVTVGLTLDRYRVDGRRVDEVAMALDLAATAPARG